MSDSIHPQAGQVAQSPRRPPIFDPPIRLGVLVSGGGSTLQNLIDRIDTGQLQATIPMVLASRPGIGAIDRAVRANLPVQVVERSGRDLASFSDAVFGHLREAHADLVVLAGFLSLISIPDDYRMRVINVHPSLIPSFCGKGFHGAAVHRAVVESGVKLSGCTVHFADDNYDTGPIIVQRAVPVLDDDTPETVAQRVFAVECEAVPEVIALYASGQIEVMGHKVRIRPMGGAFDTPS